MTTELCDSFCKNYPLFGTEYGQYSYKFSPEGSRTSKAILFSMRKNVEISEVILTIEIGTQCFCGKVLWNGAAFEDPSWVGCTMPCAGASGETCGGPWGMNLYIH